ncbi:MAG: phosphoribosylformylglycinamidine synthase subunit PurQ [Oscillospiraceae bacterium]
MVAKLPLLHGSTDTASVMAWGFDPFLSSRDPYVGALCAVAESVARTVAAGGSRKKCWLSFQEYFERLGCEATRWGKPFAALLGALDAQIKLECAAIGGKDSMSGSFESLDVPPTLISFAVSLTKASRVISPEFKCGNHVVALAAPAYDQNGIPDLDGLRRLLDNLEEQIAKGNVHAAWVCGMGGVAEGLFKMSLGNHLGVRLNGALNDYELFAKSPSAVLVECDELWEGTVAIGRTVDAFIIDQCGQEQPLHELFSLYAGRMEGVFPYRLPTPRQATPLFADLCGHARPRPAVRIAHPRVLLPAFAGTNCEYDTARAFERAGAVPQTFVVRNLSAADIEWSVREFERLIRQSQIIAIPGGFSGGDEPEGSGKFITAFFRNAHIREAVTDLLENRDGLILGICNGFQALIKLGLVPFGKIIDPSENAPTLTFNRIGRHQSKLVTTRVCSNRSPWMMYCEVGEEYVIPVSHGEGRFVADAALIADMAQNGQIAAQYVDLCGRPTLDTEFNPNFSDEAIEAISSPDGRVFARMGHVERAGQNIHMNVPGRKDPRMFEGAVDYFSK